MENYLKKRVTGGLSPEDYLATGFIGGWIMHHRPEELMGEDTLDGVYNRSIADWQRAVWKAVLQYGGVKKWEGDHPEYQDWLDRLASVPMTAEDAKNYTLEEWQLYNWADAFLYYCECFLPMRYKEADGDINEIFNDCVNSWYRWGNKNTIWLKKDTEAAAR